MVFNSVSASNNEYTFKAMSEIIFRVPFCKLPKISTRHLYEYILDGGMVSQSFSTCILRFIDGIRHGLIFPNGKMDAYKGNKRFIKKATSY